MSKVSILVAVYNAEHFLAQCLESLVNQTLNDLQIICIDDASTDESPNIIKRYAATDKRIVLLKLPENMGVSKARNRGLSIANGEWVMMLDSDDWLSKDALEQAVQTAEKHPLTDAVLFTLMYHDEANGKEWAFNNQTTKTALSGEEAFRLALDWHIHGLYMVRRSIHEVYPYDETTRLYSDDNTSRQHYLHAREVRFCKGIYYYRQHTQNATRQSGIRRIDLLDATSALKKLVENELPNDKYLLRHIEERMWINTVGVFGYYLKHKREFSKEEQLQTEERLRFYHRSVNYKRLPFSLRCKFGYIPFCRCYILFQLEVMLYFKLRLLIGKEVE